jgi:hypothetical protein
VDYGVEDVVELKKADPDIAIHDEEWKDYRVKFRACHLVRGYAVVGDEYHGDMGCDSTREGIYEPAIY